MQNGKSTRQQTKTELNFVICLEATPRHSMPSACKLGSITNTLDTNKKRIFRPNLNHRARANSCIPEYEARIITNTTEFLRASVKAKYHQK